MISQWVKRVLGRAVAKPEPPQALPQAPTVQNPGLPTVAALVLATKLPPPIKAALLDPLVGLKPESTPAAIEVAAGMLDLAYARYRGDKARMLPAVAGFIRAKSGIEEARAALIAERDESEDIELVTSHPQARSSPSNSNEIYQRRNAGK